MKAQVYEITVTDGLMDAIHGGGYRIREVFIPSIGVVINEKNIWKDPERYKIREGERFLGQNPNPVLVGDIEVKEELIEELLIIINTQEIKQDIIKAYAKTFELPQCPDCEYGHNRKEEQIQHKVVYCKTCDGHGKIWSKPK